MPRPSNGYAFFTAQLRFAARKVDRSAPAVDHVMEGLSDIADQIDAHGGFRLDPAQVPGVARGLAGVAGFLQQHILAEVIADKNIVGERQVRWTIDTAMALMTTLMTRAQMQTTDATLDRVGEQADKMDFDFTMPAAPNFPP